MTDPPPNAPDSAAYETVTASDGQCAQVAFEGWFEQRAVRWQATIVTLRRAQASRPFIEVDPAGPGADGTLAVRIGLAVPEIDHATILKTTIMIRQYKRLRRGRMEYGPSES